MRIETTGHDHLGWVNGSDVDHDHLNPLRVGADVWIGSGAIILPGCRRIDTGAVVGAGAVVTTDVPAYAIVAGNPARVIKWRFDEATRARLLASQWWLLEEATLRARAADILAGRIEGSAVPSPNGPTQQ